MTWDRCMNCGSKDHGMIPVKEVAALIRLARAEALAEVSEARIDVSTETPVKFNNRLEEIS